MYVKFYKFNSYILYVSESPHSVCFKHQTPLSKKSSSTILVKVTGLSSGYCCCTDAGTIGCLSFPVAAAPPTFLALVLAASCSMYAFFLS